MGDTPVQAGTALATTIVCVECHRPWLEAKERWRLLVLDDPDEPENVPYCPACALREFGLPR